jgi:glycerophosphoryl diester phosphodiesterase
MFPDLPHPLIFAHRGASAHAPENTLAAFREAIREGALAVEFDVKLTADGEVILLHDQTVDRTTDGGGELRKLPLAALLELDAGGWFDERYRGERIPTLAQVFEVYGRKLFMNIELTNYATPRDALVEKTANLVTQFGLEEHVLFSSFFPSNLRKAERLLPEVPRGLLAWPGLLGAWGRNIGYRSARYQALHPHLSTVTKRMIQDVQGFGRRIHAWTVNQEADMLRLFSMGVDGIFTDDPALALRVLGNRS